MSNPFAVTKEVKTSIKKVANQMVAESMIRVDSAIHQRQVIFGHIPAKSNHYRIVTFKSKDPLKKSYSHLAKSKELVQYEKDFCIQCTWYRNRMLSVPFKMEADIYYPNKRNDLDGATKALFDCIQPKSTTRPYGVGAVVNDNLCEEIILRRHIDAKNPRIEFVITPINP